MKSADSQGQIAAAGTFNTYSSDFTTKINTLQGEVNEMKFDSEAATKFKSTHDTWHDQAQHLVKQLDDMAEILRTTAKNQDATEADNLQRAVFFTS